MCPEATVFSIPLEIEGGSNKLALVRETAVELNDQAQVIRKWYVPINAIIVGIAKEELYIRYSVNTIFATTKAVEQDYVALAVKPDGSFRGTSLSEGASVTERQDCKDTSHFKGSAYVGCWKFEDVKTGRERILMFQGPCT